MAKPIDYKPCFVAFLDVLGWKDAVNRSVDDADLRARMAEAIAESYVPDMAPGFPDGLPDFPRISQFSDSIVISLSLLSGDPAANDSFFDKLSHFSMRMLLNGFFVRGAVSDGDMFHHAHIAFGPALIDAINLEKAAKYPRVVLPSGMEMPTVRIRNSDDGLPHLDILRQAMVHPEDRPAFLGRIRQIIEEKLRLYPVGSDPSIRNKYIWFARYFNEVATEFNVGLIDHDLKWEREKTLWGWLRSLVCRAA